jgi:hypothetical protein
MYRPGKPINRPLNPLWLSLSFQLTEDQLRVRTISRQAKPTT